jgi:predicted kinase
MTAHPDETVGDRDDQTPGSASTRPAFVLLTGPAGAGKSTAAAAWAAHGTDPRALIDVDALRTLIKAGMAHPEHGWTDETERQWNIGIELCAAMARVYRDNHVSTIIDVYAPPSPVDPWAALVDELDATRVTLFPSFEVCLARNAMRAREPFLAETLLRENYADFAYCVEVHPPDHLIDPSDLTIEQVVERIDAILDSPRPSGG